MKKHHIKFTLLLVALISSDVFGQGLPKTGGDGESDRIEGKFKFIPLPVVDYDNSSGITLGVLPMGMFNLSKKDSISPSSSAGLMGMYSQNKTWFVMGFGMFYINEDKWRVIAAGGFGDAHFQYYAANPINRWFRYNTNADFAYLGAQRRIVPYLYGGLSYIYTSFKTNSDYYTDSTATHLHGIGFDVDFDKRSNVAYPRRGYFVEASFTTYPNAIANQEESNQFTISYNHYFSTRNNQDVFAARFYTGVAIGNVNFNQQFVVGDTDIRGYSFGQFRGNSLLALQGEYRWNVFKRHGAVGFAGVASVFGGNNEADDGKILPGVGVGYRYVFMEETHSTIGFDVAVGDGDWGFYFRMSEAF
jgi:hypothetical protein